MTVIAIDVGGTGIKSALVDPVSFEVRHAQRHPTRAERGPEALLDNVLHVAAGLAERARTNGLALRAVGVVVPGTVDESRGMAACELGHVVVRPAGRRCRCGRRGCLEAEASARAVAERYAELTGRTATDAEVASRARAGDQLLNPLRQAVDARRTFEVGAALLAAAQIPGAAP